MERTVKNTQAAGSTQGGPSIVWAQFDTGSTLYAGGCTDHELALWTEPFRVMAPGAIQWTAFEKYCCSDTRAIEESEFLDIEHHTIHITVSPDVVFKPARLGCTRGRFYMLLSEYVPLHRMLQLRDA